MCVCGDLFDADYAMICMRGGYSVERHNEIRDLEAEIFQAVCTDVEMEPVLQEVTGEVLPRGTNKAPDARLDIRAPGFWAKEQSAFFDVRVCHPNPNPNPKNYLHATETSSSRSVSCIFGVVLLLEREPRRQTNADQTSKWQTRLES